jgi:polar amino acid transport system substrate-binding protein
MPKLRLPFSWHLLVLLLLSPLAGGTAGLMLDTEDTPPYQMQDQGRVRGFVADKVREMLNRAGLQGIIAIRPWQRAYQDAQLQSDHCVFPTTRTPEREGLFKWVGPIAFSEWTLFARADRKLRLNQLDDAKPYVIGSYNGDVRDSYLRERGFKVDTAPEDQLNPQKLLYRRIDLWVADKYGASVLLRQRGWDRDIVPVYTFRRFSLYLACNPDTPDGVLKKLGDALDRMNEDGSAAAIERRYQRWPNS